MEQLAGPPPELSDEYRNLLAALFRIYPTRISLDDLSTIFNLSYPVMEKMCEDLVERKLVNVAGARVCLAKTGRDYCIEHGLDKDT